jgi:hypothetical protein
LLRQQIPTSGITQEETCRHYKSRLFNSLSGGPVKDGESGSKLPLDALEKQRRSCVRSRNIRLVALLSFLHYAAQREPAALASISHTLAIPIKRFDRVPVSYLSREDVTAILTAPDRNSWSGDRDAVMLATMYNTGARVSEIIRLSVWKTWSSGPLPQSAFPGRDLSRLSCCSTRLTRRQRSRDCPTPTQLNKRSLPALKVSLPTNPSPRNRT